MTAGTSRTHELREVRVLLDLSDPARQLESTWESTLLTVKASCV
jgi:hypothetical protein